MLPSRGFFKKNDCPFYEKGLCVRPHCHFRHKKKLVSGNSPTVNFSEDITLTDTPIESTTSSEICAKVECLSSTSTSDKAHACSGEKVKEVDHDHDSLFAKLVNQSNPYEKINRHIPCAYTPTPQIKTAQPKHKGAVNKQEIDNLKTLNSFSNINNESRTSGFDLVNSKQINNSYETKNNHDINKLDTKQYNIVNLNNINNVYSVYSQKCSFSSKDTDSLSYEPQLTSKSISSDLNTKKIEDSDYVPGSVINNSESQYVPSGNDSLPDNYVPSKNKSKPNQYIPEPTGKISSQITYKPSGKPTSTDNQYQPVVGSCPTDYVPTKKSATKTTGASWLNEGEKITEFEFISSEIELMKELLNEDCSNNDAGKKKNITKTEIGIGSEQDKQVSKLKKEKSREKDRSNRSSSSKHKADSSSSSKHKHSGSSSKYLPRSSSSRHHSSKSHSSSNKSSDHHKSLSDRHKSNSKNSHKNSNRHKSKRSSREKEKKTREVLVKKSVKDLEDDQVSLGDNMVAENGDNESETESKKRKNTWTDEENKKKFFKKSDEELFDDLEEDPDVVEKECLEIFNSYKNSDLNAIKKINDVTVSTDEHENALQPKKRTAHATVVTSDHSVLRHKTLKKINNIKSAQEVMLERYKTIEKAKEVPPSVPVTQPSPIQGLSKPPFKIAAVSNIQQMLEAKKAIQEKINFFKVNQRKTMAHSVALGSQRVAHTPSVKNFTEKPIITTGSKKVPQFKRQIYLDKLLLETNQIYPTKGESAEEALKLEEEVFRANQGSFSAYNAAFMSVLLKTRRRISAVKGETSVANPVKRKVSHNDILSGGKKNFSVIRTKKVDISMLTDRHIYDELLRCKLTPEDLKLNGFPMELDKPGYASCTFNFELKYNTKYLHIKKMTENRRYCIRCSKQYEVDPVTLQQYKEGPETCCYHPGKKKSGGRNCERIYNCCNSSSTEGCATHIRHVTDCNDYDNLPNCVKTLSKDDQTNPGVFALDCEMVYTRLGYELARVTVVNLKKEVVYDTLVKPKYPVECYNTFYSGIEESMLDGVQTTLKDVQAVLLSMFSDKTILIGHSLDSDLRALHLIHETVVDSAVFYKNEKYHPYKYSLKDLCARKISKIIQENIGGHDSAEDAIAALEIMLNHVKEEVGKYDSLESYEADRSN